MNKPPETAHPVPGPPAPAAVAAPTPEEAITPPTPDEVRAARETVHPDYRLSFVLEPDGRVRHVTEIRGLDAWPQEGLVGLTLGEISTRQTGTERGDMWHVRIEQAKQAELPVQYLDPLPGGDHDAPRSVGSTVTPVRAADGELQAIVVEIEDLSGPEKSQRQLVESEARFRGLAETLPQMVWESDGAGNARYLSPKWMAFSGLPVGELLGRGYMQLIHPDDLRHMGAARDGGLRQRPIAFRLRRHDGVYRWMEAYIEVIHDDGGQATQAIGTAIDVTDRRAAEDTARENHEQLVRALTITGLGRYSLSVTTALVTIDERGANIFGLPRDTICGPQGARTLMKTIHADDVDRFERAVIDAKAGDADLDVECRIMRPGEDGPELRWIAVNGRLDRESDGPPRVLGLVEDITDRRHAEEARLRSQKREMIGTLVGGIAHDFNNVISAILSNASVGRAELAAGDSSETSLVEIERGAKRAAELVQRVLVQGRDDVTAHEPFDIASVVDEACALLRPGLPPDVELVQAREYPLPALSGSATQVHQLVVNLVTNAAQALAGTPGTIEVSLQRSVGPRGAVGGAPPAGIRLLVRDDGPGMSTSVLDRVFDPYFTTKPPGEGTGLGLSAAHTIVRAHGGRIDVDSVLGSHTVFTVDLPGLDDRGSAASTRAAAQDRPAVPTVDRPTADEAHTGGARVLFVDDEASLVRLAERALPASGFSPAAFVDAEKALEAFAAAPRSFDALVTDLSMPGLDGLGLIEQIRALRPELPVILTSGFMTAANRGRARELGVNAVVPKPCSIADLVGAIRAVVSG